ncbi:MAG TPA: type VII secretion integral membrane protein EccD [Streptosporangiaceae bacterium]|jgi:type VII secretion integral membrane protein EccD|nr:type VII secretion integral membrane protein EccD [Streptosporangiaceae bacterium]
MSPASGADMCRITIVGPHRRVDLALPGYVPFAELFPTVAQYAGLDQTAGGIAPSGWVLQRLGRPPFPPDATPVQAGLRDGELIYLNPRSEQLPELAFDDVADVIAVGIGDRPDRWGPGDTRRVAFGAAALGLIAGVAALCLAGPPWTVPALAAGVFAILLLGAAAAASRAAGDAGAAVVLGCAALPYAFLAGFLAPARSAALSNLGSLEVLSGFAALLLAATIAAAATAGGSAVFIGAVGAAILAGGGAAADFALGHMGLDGAAAVAATVALALTPLIPAAAFRLGKLSLPPVPRDADELRRDTLTVQGGHVLDRTAAADRVVTGAVSGIGMLVGGAEIALAFAPGWLPRLMCAALGCALLLRSRVFRGRAQRLWLLVPGYGGLAMLAMGVAVSAPPGRIVAVILPLLAVGAAFLVGAGVWLPGRRSSPFWGRAAEIVDLALVISLIPLALAVTGVFGYIRGLSG